MASKSLKQLRLTGISKATEGIMELRIISQSLSKYNHGFISKRSPFIGAK